MEKVATSVGYGVILLFFVAVLVRSVLRLLGNETFLSSLSATAGYCP